MNVLNFACKGYQTLVIEIFISKFLVNPNRIGVNLGGGKLWVKFTFFIETLGNCHDKGTGIFVLKKCCYGPNTGTFHNILHRMAYPGPIHGNKMYF